mmetsp:Transcript_7209/g.19323  ORF Transcript_7209/g.19323 Transcript_7209/m.19323 type:complete len:135 (+) Transcript_7209:92-496(+)
MAARENAAARVIKEMAEATGASQEDCRIQLQLSNGDPNRATEQLLSNPFSTVSDKKKKKEQAREQQQQQQRRKRRRRGRKRRPQSLMQHPCSLLHAWQPCKLQCQHACSSRTARMTMRRRCKPRWHKWALMGCH